MFPKFSVKKPITILVAVILIIVLGIVSFTNMTPDLLPSIDLPYVIVLTTYPGASPEMVEKELTRPVSSAMATLDNINNVSGKSSDNYSLVLLQFTDGANLDTATIDIREKLNLLSGSWDEMVGTSTILKINPDMLPVMVAAVDQEDTSLADLSTFVDQTLLSRLESIEGVASVSASGLLEETVLVSMDNDRMDALNQRVFDAINKKFDDALADIQKTRDELTGKSADVEEQREQIESGRAELESARQTLDEQMASAGAELDEKRAELQDTKEQLFDARADLLDKQDQLISTQESLLTLQSTLTQLNTTESTLDATIATLSQTIDTVTTLENAQAAFNTQIAAISARTDLTDVQKQAMIAQITSSQSYQQVAAGLGAVDAQLAAQGLTRADLSATLQKATSGKTEIAIARQQINDQLAAQDMTTSDIPKALQDVENGMREITSGLNEIQNNIQKLNDGQITIDEAKASLPDKRYEATSQLYEGIAQVEVGAQAVNAAQSQLDAALEQLDEAEDTIAQQREEACKQADLSAKINRQTIASLLYAQNFAMPAGYIADGTDQYLIRVGDTLSGVEELTDLVLFDTGDDLIGPVKLTDVAEVTVVDNADELYAKINGRQGVLLSFNKQSGYATATVAASISKEFDSLSGEFEGLTFTQLMNQGDYIGLVVDSVLQNLLMGAAFAIVILFFFLWDIRPTAIVACSIPISVTFAIVLMYFSSVTLNIISLSGLAVGVGMLVDNSIVVIENIYRLRAAGMSAVRAAVQGAKQVTAAITASTLTTVCVFFPIVFVQGLTRELFTDMALTIGYSLLASLLVAITLVPAMASGILRKPPKPSKKQYFARFTAFYRRTVEWALHHKAAVLVTSLVLLVASGLLEYSKGFSYMPEMSSSQIMIDMSTPDGTPLSETADVSDRMVEDMLEVPGVETVGSMLSSGMGSIIGLNTGSAGNTTSLTMYVLLDETGDPSEVTAAVQEILDRYPVEASITANSSMAGASTILGGSGVSLRVYGDDLAQLQQTALELKDVLSGVEGCVNASAAIGETNPELRITVDKNKAAENGLTVAQIYQALAADLTTEVTATEVTQDGAGRDVVVVSTLNDALKTRVLSDYDLTVSSPDGTEKTVKLRDVASITETRTPAEIRRSAAGRYIEVTAGLAEGYNVTKVTAAAEEVVDKMELPAGQSVVFTGENETILSAMNDLALMLLLGVLIVYLIMVAQFQSLLSPLIVMFTIPLAFTGSFIALLVANMELSVVAMIGLIMLVGIIVNNGIVLVDYTNQLRRAGMDRHEAVAEAAATRIRPIFMTAVTTILGLLPLALGLGMGSSMVQPVAVVCIGGLLYATLMTLYVIPVLYDLMARRPLRNVRDEDIDEEIGTDPLSEMGKTASAVEVAAPEGQPEPAQE